MNNQPTDVMIYQAENGAIELRHGGPRKHITQGYTINPSRIEQNLNTFLQTVEEIKTLTRKNTTLETNNVLALISAFAHTWFSLESYEDTLPKRGLHHDVMTLESDALYQAVAELKRNFI